MGSVGTGKYKMKIIKNYKVVLERGILMEILASIIVTGIVEVGCYLGGKWLNDHTYYEK